MKRIALAPLIVASLLLAACGKAPAPPPPAPTLNETVPATNGAIAPAPPSPPPAVNAADPGLIPASRVKVPLDERTLDGAQKVAKAFVSLTMGKRPDDASRLWRDDEQSRTALARGTEVLLRRHYLFSMTYFAQGSEGAAGSLFTEIPTELHYRDGDKPMVQPVFWTLRRVNDVPGATPEQLSWRLVDVRIGEPTDKPVGPQGYQHTLR